MEGTSPPCKALFLFARRPKGASRLGNHTRSSARRSLVCTLNQPPQAWPSSRTRWPARAISRRVAFLARCGWGELSWARFGDPALHFGRWPEGRAPDASRCFLFLNLRFFLSMFFTHIYTLPTSPRLYAVPVAVPLRPFWGRLDVRNPNRVVGLLPLRVANMRQGMRERRPRFAEATSSLN